LLRITALAEIGALVGDPGRASMMLALMDGRALTATELARFANLAPQTASGHLSRLLTAHLLLVERQGRHRYYRLASQEIARMLETIMHVAAEQDIAKGTRKIHVGPKDEALRDARTCYDHLAGRLGVRVADAMTRRGFVELDADGGTVTEDGQRFLREFGVDLDTPPKAKRIFIRSCLDWSERRPHLGGHVATILTKRYFQLDWIRRQQGSRAVMVTPHGREGFQKFFGFSGLPSLDEQAYQ
jgi:DNA-binding transcriptional ArsR family regulator